MVDGGVDVDDDDEFAGNAVGDAGIYSFAPQMSMALPAHGNDSAGTVAEVKQVLDEPEPPHELLGIKAFSAGTSTRIRETVATFPYA